MQGPLTQFEGTPFIFSLIGVIRGVLCLIPLDEEFVAHLVQHMAFKVSTEYNLKKYPCFYMVMILVLYVLSFFQFATLVAATSRLIDAIFICCHTTRERANYFRCRLQEIFIWDSMLLVSLLHCYIERTHMLSLPVEKVIFLSYNIERMHMLSLQLKKLFFYPAIIWSHHKNAIMYLIGNCNWFNHRNHPSKV